MSEQVQKEAKDRIIEILKSYDVRFIDYDAEYDEYTIRLGKIIE